MKKLNRNNANINEILNKKVAIVCYSKEKELDFRKWAKQYVNSVEEDYVFTNCGNGIRITLEHDGLKWDYTNYFLENNYSIYEWEIAEEENTCTKKIKDAKPLTKEKKEILKSCLPQKTYTIKDVVENEGKIYRTTTNDCIYKYNKNFLYYKAIWELSADWRKTGLNLGEIIKLKFIEYKPEPKKITFKEALKKMETKVCRCLFSNRCITINASHFVDCSNGAYTSLSLPEIQSEWVVIEE